MVSDGKHKRQKHLMRAGKEKGSYQNEKIDESIPDGLEDGPDLDDLLADPEGPDTETCEEPDLGLVQSNEDTEELGGQELGDESPEQADDPVRTYMRELGMVSLLTRESEIDLAKRIERGQTRVKKALSRAPS